MMQRVLLLTLPVLIIAAKANDSIVAVPQTQQQESDQLLPEGEKRIRHGIILLGTLCQRMGEIKNHDSAEAAVPHMMRICEELKIWSQSFTNLPPVSSLEIQVYEERYLPAIRKINQLMEAQADRLAAAEYYGSRNLPAALVRIAQINQ